MDDSWGTLTAILALSGALVTSIVVIWKALVKVRDIFRDVKYLKKKQREMAETLGNTNDKVIPLRARVSRNERDINALGEKIDDGFEAIATESKTVHSALGELSGLIKAMGSK